MYCVKAFVHRSTDCLLMTILRVTSCGATDQARRNPGTRILLNVPR